jgi:hypothetical protein
VSSKEAYGVFKNGLNLLLLEVNLQHQSTPRNNKRMHRVMEVDGRDLALLLLGEYSNLIKEEGGDS